MNNQEELCEAVKDLDRAHGIPSAWRPILQAVVKAFAAGDFALKDCPVAPVSAATAKRMAANVASYGETLSELPTSTWTTSVSQWMGTHWELLVDLWTVESGASDLVLSVRVFEADGGFRFEVESVHVP
jgi:hypothetical protein